MKIREIEIKKYKSITDPLKIRNFSDFNILVGPNNAGKTNILDSLEVFFNTEKKNLNRKKSILKLKMQVNNQPVNLLYRNGILDHDLSQKEYNRLTQRVVRLKDSLPINKIATKKLESFKRKDNEKYNLFSRTIENYFQEMQMSEDLFKANILTGKGKKPLKRMGDGFKRLFVILFYVYNPEYELILIDEPEIHLHPSIIKKFLKILNEKNLPNQVVMTTHHPTFVQAKFLDKTWRVARNKNLSTSVYQMEGEKIKKDRFVQEINDDNSAMLFADKVLLVEGVSDSILMRGLIDKFYEKTKDIKVVYSGGIGDIDLYEKVCETFNIPYVIMIDGDALDIFWRKKFKSEKNISGDKKRKLLKEKEIFVLEGTLEQNYPRKYQKRDTKPLNALSAAKKIKKEDYESSKMEGLREVIKNL